MVTDWPVVISVARGSNCNLNAFSAFYRLFPSFAFFIFTSNYKEGESLATQRFCSAEGCSRLSAMLPHVIVHTMNSTTLFFRWS